MRKGLVANLLWLPETEYPVRDKNKPGLAITAWVQYMLDNFATVEEAVAYIDEDTFQVVSDMMPDGSVWPLYIYLFRMLQVTVPF